MKESSPAEDAKEKISALIATLHATGKSLEELTTGEVDTVADHEGQTFVLRHAQEHLRNVEAAKQAAILNPLPPYIALVDTHGVIVSVNDAWRRFADRNVIHAPGLAVGVNYLEACDDARGADSAEAHHVAEGIRSVLGGGIDSFSIEYRCRSPTGDSWFMLTATPLAGERPNGAVVMHVDVTERNRTMQDLRESEQRFSQMAENISDVFFLQSVDGSQIHYVSAAYEAIWGRTRDSLYANPGSWADAIHPDDRASTCEKYREGMPTGTFEVVYRILRPDGSIRWIEAKGVPVHDDHGEIVRITGLASDITERKAAEEVLTKRAAELERFHRLSVGREMQMIELKKEVNALAAQAGQEPPYKLSFSA